MQINPVAAQSKVDEEEEEEVAVELAVLLQVSERKLSSKTSTYLGV